MEQSLKKGWVHVRDEADGRRLYVKALKSGSIRKRYVYPEKPTQREQALSKVVGGHYARHMPRKTPWRKAG